MIETERLLLRPWRDADRGPFSAINADPEVMEHLGPPMTRAASDAAMDRQQALAGAGAPCFWAAERKRDGVLLGFIGIKQIPFAPLAGGYEIGWRLGRDYWGAGYATEGAKAALAYGFAARGLAEILSFTIPANLRSLAVMRRIGMRRVENGDFDHPNFPEGDPLRRHVLFKALR